MEEKRVTVEDHLGDLGFRLRWSVLDHWADVEVFEIAGREVPSETALFLRDGWSSSGDLVEDINEAEPYLTGFVKWDGCTELNQGQPHWCGPHGYKKHIDLLRHIYHRAFELMGREPEEPWDETPNTELKRGAKAPEQTSDV